MKWESTNDNIVPFPGSADKLVKAGMEALKNGEKEKALQHFKEALSHEQKHTEASYGLLLAYADTGQLKKGKALAEKMLKEATGDYYEVLQVYVSILAQLGEYDKVVSVLEAILEEDRFPPEMAERLYELLDLSRHMAASETYTEDNPTHKISNRSFSDWRKRLENGTSEQKLAALGELRRRGPFEALSVIEHILADRKSSPLMQSFLLLLLKDWKVEKQIWVKKMDRKGEFSPASLPAVEETTSYIKSSQLLEDTLGHIDPVLLKNAYHLLHQILLFFYPFPPSLQIEALAAILHYEAATQAGMEADAATLAIEYGASEAAILKVQEEYEKIRAALSEI